MIDFREVIDALNGEMSASALRRQDIGAEMTRLHLENDTCLSTENEIRAALGALTRLAEKQAAAAPADPLPAERPAESGNVAAPVAAIEAAPPEPADAPIEAKPAPAKVDGPRPGERVAVPIIDAKPDEPAESIPMGEGRRLANRIAADLSNLMREFPEGPTIRQLAQWYEAPEMRVRDACRILGTDRKASMQKRKSTGFLHLLPHGARP